MHPRLRLRSLATVTVAALTLGCAATNAGSFIERGMDVRRYQTYGWAPTEMLATGDPRLDNNPFFHERVQRQIERQLTSRGFERAVSGAPDLLVHYHASVKQAVNADGADRPYTYCEDCRPYVYDAGTLVIDLVDAQTTRLVWRGWAEESIDGVVDDQDWMEERIDRSVARILDRLPGRL